MDASLLGPDAAVGLDGGVGIAGQDPERFYCPYPGCNRSFAELWRLKVHFRAPPDIRGSGKERGHGTELTHCPKCNKTLKPGKHHVGCSGGKTAPRQAIKRSRVGSDGGSGPAEEEDVDGPSSSAPPVPRRKPVAGQGQQPGMVDQGDSQRQEWAQPSPSGVYFQPQPGMSYWTDPNQPMNGYLAHPGMSPYPQFTVAQVYNMPQQPGMPPPVMAQQFTGYPPNVLPVQMQANYGQAGPMQPTMVVQQGQPQQAGMPPQAQLALPPGTTLQPLPHTQPQPTLALPAPPAPQGTLLPSLAPQPMLQAATTSPHAVPPSHMSHAQPQQHIQQPAHPQQQSTHTQVQLPQHPPQQHVQQQQIGPGKAGGPGTSAGAGPDEPGSDAPYDLEEFTKDFGRVPSPPPLPPDFHSMSGGPSLLFNFAQFSQKLPHNQSMTALDKELAAAGLELPDPGLLYDHTDDGDIMQLLFGVPDDVPTMATIHMHAHRLNDEDDTGSLQLPSSLGGSQQRPASSSGRAFAQQMMQQAPNGDMAGQGQNMQQQQHSMQDQRQNQGMLPPQQLLPGHDGGLMQQQQQHPVGMSGPYEQRQMQHPMMVPQQQPMQGGMQGQVQGGYMLMHNGSSNGLSGPHGQMQVQGMEVAGGQHVLSPQGPGDNAAVTCSLQAKDGPSSMPPQMHDDHHPRDMLDGETFRLLQSCD